MTIYFWSTFYLKKCWLYDIGYSLFFNETSFVILISCFRIKMCFGTFVESKWCVFFQFYWSICFGVFSRSSLLPLNYFLVNFFGSIGIHEPIFDYFHHNYHKFSMYYGVCVNKYGLRVQLFVVYDFLDYHNIWKGNGN